MIAMQGIQNPTKILIINIFGIGDVLFTTPLVANLKAQFPKARIGYVCNERSLAVLKNNPHIEKIFIYSRDEWVGVYRKSIFAYFNKLRHFIKSIRQEGYDVVFDLSLSGFMGFITK